MSNSEEFNQRLSELEGRLSLSMSSPAQRYDSSEIDLRELLGVLWEGKFWVFGVVFLFLIAGVFYAKSLPDIYKSAGVYAPAQKESGGGMASQFGGLAAMAGVNLGGGESNDIEQAISLMKSWPFLEGFIGKYDLKPFLMGIERWDSSTDKVHWDPDVYDVLSGEWMLDTNGISVEPTSYEVFSRVSKLLTVNKDSTTGLINVSLEFYIPELSKKWLELLIQEVNVYFQQRDIDEAVKSIEFLKTRVEATSISEMHEVFYKMIESQTKVLMLAEVNDEYLMQTVVPPKTAEVKSKPSRVLICVVFMLVGFILSFVFLLVRYFVK